MQEIISDKYNFFGVRTQGEIVYVTFLGDVYFIRSLYPNLYAGLLKNPSIDDATANSISATYHGGKPVVWAFYKIQYSYWLQDLNTNFVTVIGDTLTRLLENNVFARFIDSDKIQVYTNDLPRALELGYKKEKEDV